MLETTEIRPCMHLYNWTDKYNAYHHLIKTPSFINWLSIIQRASCGPNCNKRCSLLHLLLLCLSITVISSHHHHRAASLHHHFTTALPHHHTPTITASRYPLPTEQQNRSFSREMSESDSRVNVSFPLWRHLKTCRAKIHS